MAFLGDLGKKISDAGQGVAQSTRNFAEVSRLSGAISDKEKEIGGLYASLGKLYYEGHSQDPEAEGADLIRSINALKEDVERCQEEIRRIKGMGKCPSCGAGLPQGAAFCTACGAAVAKEAAPAAQRVCPSCGKTVGGENKFCNFCGAKLD